MLNDNKPIGVQPSTPDIAPEIEGAPVSMPGGNDGTDKTKMSGTPVASASVPPPVSNDLAGALQAGQEEQSPPTPTIAVSTDTAGNDDNVGESKEVPTTDTDSAPTAPTQTDEERERAERERAERERAERERADAVAGSDRQIKTLQDWLDAEENRPETAEQRKKRERKEKSKKIVSAISDGLSALSNLFFTSQYAPNMYNHEKGSQLTATNDRIERLKAEREKKKDQYLNFSLKLGDIENDRAKTLRELEAKQEARRLAREKAERDAEQHKWLAALQPDKQREQAGKADKAEQEAITAQAEAQYAPQMQKAKLETEHARAGAQKATAVNSYASARAHDRSNQNEFSAWDEQGKEHKFRTEDAAIAFAKQHGTYKEVEVEEKSDTTSKSGQRTTTRSTTKKTKQGHAAKPDPTGMDDPTA